MSYQKILHISERGQVVIPKKIRDLGGLGKSNRIKIILDDNDKVTLEPIKGFALELEGSAKDMLNEKDILKYVRDLRDERE